MPILKVTAADILKSKLIDAGWYKAEVVKVSDLKASTAGDSANVVVTFMIEGTDGKEIDRYFNSKAIGMIVPVFAAAEGKTMDQIKPEEMMLDTDKILHKKLDVKVVNDTFEGRMVNKIDDFLPYGKSSEKAPF